MHYTYACVCVHYRIAGNFRKAKFSKNLRESDFKKIFSKILLLSQLSSCVAIEIRKNIFENDWLFSKFSKITSSNFSCYTVFYNLLRFTHAYVPNCIAFPVSD